VNYKSMSQLSSKARRHTEDTQSHEVDAGAVVALRVPAKGPGEEQARIHLVLILLGDAVLHGERPQRLRGQLCDEIGAGQLHRRHARGIVGGKQRFVGKNMLLGHEEVHSDVAKR
jgi:hypothetical protein